MEAPALHIFTEGRSLKENAPQPLPLRSNIAWNTFGCLFYQGCLWLTTIAVVWLSGYDDAGVLALAMAVGNIFASIALYKMRTFQVADVTDTYPQASYSALRFITVAAAFLICVPYAIATTQGATTVAAVIVFMLFKADEAFADFLYGVDQRGMRMDYIGRSQIMRGVLAFAAFCGGLHFGGSLLAAVACMFACCFAVTLLYDLPHARRFCELKPRISRATAVKMLLLCLPAVLASLCGNAVVSVARQYLGAMSGDAVLGVYASIATPAVLAQAAVSYLYSPMIGGLAESWEKGERAALARYLGKMVLAIALAVAACCALLLLVGPPLLLALFGSSLESSLYIFPFVLLCTALVALIWLATDVLIVFHRTWQAFAANAAALAIAALASPWCIESFGINGINFSIAAAYALGIILAAIFIAGALHDKTAPFK